MEQLFPVLSGVIGAIAAWSISSRQESQKSKQFDLEYVRQIVDQQMQGLREERVNAHAEIIRLRERIAVLESQSVENERQRGATIVRLQRENEELRRANAKMSIELRHLQKQWSSCDVRRPPAPKPA